MSMFRFLPGIIIVEAAMVALVTAFMNASTEANWIPMALLVAIVTVLVAFWFGSIADHVKKDALAQAKDDFVRDRENLLVAAEADKRKVVEQSHKQLIKETNQVHAKANFKLGAAFVGILSIGAVLLSVELMTIGLLTLTTAGGALAGYVIRARQDALAYRSKLAQIELDSPMRENEVLESKPRSSKRLTHKA